MRPTLTRPRMEWRSKKIAPFVPARPAHTNGGGGEVPKPISHHPITPTKVPINAQSGVLAHSSSLGCAEINTVSFHFPTHDASKAVPAFAGRIISDDLPAGSSVASQTLQWSLWCWWSSDAKVWPQSIAHGTCNFNHIDIWAHNEPGRFGILSHAYAHCIVPRSSRSLHPSTCTSNNGEKQESEEEIGCHHKSNRN